MIDRALRRTVLASLALCLGLLGATPFAWAHGVVRTQAQGGKDVDIAQVIHEAAHRKAGSMKVGTAQAVHRLDDILVSDYGARGRIVGESNAELKGLYTQAASLLMNGHPIAGGTLVVIARQEPAYARSACGPALGAFVDGMLAPVGESDDGSLGEFAQRASKARAILAKLRPELQMAAQLRVMGAIYHDDIAVDAGKTALGIQQASPAEKAVVEAALVESHPVEGTLSRLPH